MIAKCPIRNYYNTRKGHNSYYEGIAAQLYDSNSHEPISCDERITPYLFSLVQMYCPNTYRTNIFVFHYSNGLSSDFVSELQRIEHTLNRGYAHIKHIMPRHDPLPNHINVYIIGDDLEPFLTEVIGTTGMSWPELYSFTIPQESGGHLFLGFVTPAFHELLHIMMPLSNQESHDINGRDAPLAFERSHLLIKYYSMYLEYILALDTDRGCEWMFIDPCQYWGNVSTDNMSKQLKNEWIHSNGRPLQTIPSFGKPTQPLFDELFYYLASTRNEDVFLDLLRNTSHDSYPWNVLNIDAKHLSHNIARWEKDNANTLGHYVALIVKARGNVPQETYESLLNSPMPIRTSLNIAIMYLQMIDCNYLGVSKLKEGEQKELIREVILSRAKHLAASLPADDLERGVINDYIKMLDVQPNAVQYSSSSQWGIYAVKICTPNVIERVKKYAGSNNLYRILITKYANKRPFYLTNLIACFNNSKTEEEKQRYAVRILTHPSVQLSESIYSKVVSKCPSILQYVECIQRQKPKYLTKQEEIIRVTFPHS